ncbi:MAG: low temperature requirement protein A [Deltaproteobacteria bacterium]
MRNRWFHRPLYHAASTGAPKRSGWLELFFDLVFVAAFLQLGSGLAKEVSFERAAVFAAVFVALWVAWSGLTFVKNRYTVDDFLHRALVFLQILAVGAMALAAPDVLVGDVRAFAIASGVAQLLVAVMYGRAYLQVGDGRPYARYWGLIFGLGGVLWVASAWIPAPYYAAPWAIATLVLLGAPLSRQSREVTERDPIDHGHLAERYGLLTIIVLGESFVKALMALAESDMGAIAFARVGVVLIVTYALWWIYFDDVAGAKLRGGAAAFVVWLYAHVTLPLGITAVGVGLQHLVTFSWSTPAAPEHRYLIAGALALTFMSVAAIDSVCERKVAELSDRARVNVRWMSGIFLLVLAAAGDAMSGGMFMVLVTAVCVAHVVFDMAMAPFEEAEHLEIGHRPIAELAKSGEEPEEAPRRWDVSDAVRVGTPSSVRSDLYFYFMHGSWTRVFVAFALVFLVANLFFAALFLLEPGAVANAEPRSFADAFFFSVQTMSTIGYGTLSPATPYADAIVTVEAAVAIVGTAVITGLVFAKASRAKSSVLFSEPVVVTKVDGRDVLMIRVGNARGNEVVDASMDFTVILDETSKEGRHLRRLHALKLARNRSPMFTLSWLVMHDIDEDSPLHGIDWDGPQMKNAIFVATLIGHDGTYGQTIYARKVYYYENLRCNAHFVDIMSQLEDGRLMIDFAHFHDTEADELPSDA